MDDDRVVATRATDVATPSSGESWIGTGSMTDDGIEIIWSVPVEEWSLQIHRFDHPLDGDIDTIEPVNGSPIATATGSGTFTDDTAEPGRFYTYLLVGDNDVRRWTTGLARTDVDPPSPITGLTAEVTAEGVLLTWDQSDDDVEFGAYAVSLVGDDGTMTYLGGGAEVNATGFVDVSPPDGEVTYAVQAVDFHNNRTEPATVTVTVTN